MDKNNVLKAITELKKNSKKREFKQTYDIIINLKELNLKKPEENVNDFLVLPFPRGKKVRTCALVGNELVTKAKAVCNQVIHKDDFEDYDKKSIKKLARNTDFFIAQANLMTDIAKVFGKILGPTGKMPNPKSGCVVPPIVELAPLIEKLNKTVRLQTKNELIVKTLVGSEDMKDDEIAENILAIYNYLIHHLPQEKHNIKNILIKLTMEKPVKIE